MLKPKAGVSTLYEKAEAVLKVDPEFRFTQFGGPFVLFSLRMPASFNLVGLDHDITVAVPLADCEEVP